MTVLNRRVVSNIRSSVHNYIWFTLAKQFGFKRLFQPFQVDNTVIILHRAESFISSKSKRELRQFVKQALDNGFSQQLYTIIQEELQKPILTLGKLVVVLYLARQISKYYILIGEDSRVNTIIDFLRIQLELRQSRTDDTTVNRTDSSFISHSVVIGIIGFSALILYIANQM